MTAIRLLIGRLRRDRLPALLLMVLVLVTALIAAAAPRLFNRVADAGLRYQVSQASSVERNFELGRITRIETGPNAAMDEVAAVEDSLEAELPDSVRGVLSGDSSFAESIVWRVPDRPPERPGYLTLHFEDGLEDRIELVDGRVPTGEVPSVEADPPPGTVVEGDIEYRIQVFEVALSEATAEALGASVGDRLDLVSDPDDPLVGARGVQEATAVEVVGIYRVRDAAADFWMGDFGLQRPNRVPVGINTVLIYATALASPDAYPAMTRISHPLRYTFRYYVDPERLDAGMLDRLVVDLRQMDASYARFATGPDPDRTTLQTGMLELTQAYLAERRTTEAVLTTAAIGPAAVALGAIAVLALLAARRRERSLVLVRGRGGSAWQVVASHLIEGLLLTAAPAAIAVLLVTWLIEARPAPASSVAAAAVAIGTLLVIAGASLPTAFGSLRRISRDAPTPIGASPRRLAFEALAVGLAIGGVVLLRQRGLAGGSVAGQLEGVDPFLAAVPALVGLAVAIATVRLYPYPLRAAGVVAAAGRGIVPPLGLRRAERQSGTGHLPLVVLLLTVAIGAFSSTMLATIDTGQRSASWQEVGAAYRIDGGGPLPEDFEVSDVAGVSAVAGMHETDASVGIGGSGRVPMIAVDPAAYEEVTAGTPAETTFPASFEEPVDPVCIGEADEPPDEHPVCPGTTESPIPAIVSRALARESTTSLEVGDAFQLTVDARFATFEVVELRDAILAHPVGSQFVVVPRPLLTAAISDRAFPDTSLFVRAPADASDALRDALPAGARLDSQAEEVAALRDRPLVTAVATGFAIALGIAVAYAALAVILSLVLSGAARARETAHLRTLGIGPGQVTWLTVLEHGPSVIVAVVAGLLLGALVAWVVLPGLGLSAFTGAPVDPVLTIDVGQLVVLTAALVVIVAVGVGLAAWLQRAADPASAVREGME